MFKQIARRVIGPVVEASITSATSAWGSLPVPEDQPRVFAMGPDADHVLLFGGSGVAGVGVSSNELGLGGHLARELSALTGRGTDVEIDGDLNRSVVRGMRDLAVKDLSRYDALVIQIGAREAIGLKSVRLWRRDVRALIQLVESTAPTSLAVFLVGIPLLPLSLGLAGAIQRVVGRHTARLNLESSRACAGSRIQFLPFAPEDEALAERYGGASRYAAWAKPIATGLRAALDAATQGPRDSEICDEELRLRSLADLVDLDDTADTRFDPIVGMARDLFGVAGAALNFVDRDSLRTYSGAGVPEGAWGRAGTFCNEAIARDEILVLPDTDLDDRFAHHTNGEGDRRVRFYAGYPIEAPNGQRLGTLCIIDVVPREFTAEDASLLRELALRVQSLLWVGRPIARPRR